MLLSKLTATNLLVLGNDSESAIKTAISMKYER